MSYKKIKDINVLVDSRSSVYGDEYEIDLGQRAIVAGKNQLIRINLTYFNMYNNLYGVNFSNGYFTSAIDFSGQIIETTSNINFQNYYSLHEIVSDFAVKLGTSCKDVTNKNFRVKEIKNTILNRFTPFIVDSQLDSTPSRATHDGNQLLDITLEAVVVINGIVSVIDHEISDLKITFQNSDLYLILGGLKNFENTYSSLLVDISSNFINVKGYFPMQRSSENSIYLRCNVAGNSFASLISNYGNEITPSTYHDYSDILGIFSTNTELIEYTNVNNIFSIDVKSSHLQKFTLKLTDSKNRPLISTYPAGTAAGLQNQSMGGLIRHQNTEGNLNFKALLNIELLQY
jgi:hypothetical protein